MTFLESFPIKNGVYELTPIDTSFESAYLKVREAENRVLTDEMVKKLPFTSSKLAHAKEWKLRQFSAEKVQSYFGKKNLQILDLGCGNGWFSNCISEADNLVLGIDVNMLELKQASRVFQNNKLKFCYGDVFKAQLPVNYFDTVTLNASVQYFPNFQVLINRLFQVLKNEGEIHLIDSPIYQVSEVAEAKNRTTNYYKSVGFPEMSEHYFHRTWNELKPFNHQVLYSPTSILNRVKKLVNSSYSPFPWVVIRK